MHESKTFSRQVQLMGLLLLLAPFGNILISFSGAGVSEWYKPDVLLYFLKSIPWWEWFWLSILAISGISLLLKQRFATYAVWVSLFIAICINITRLILQDENSIELSFLNIFSPSAIVVCIVSGLFFYKRHYQNTLNG